MRMCNWPVNEMSSTYAPRPSSSGRSSSRVTAAPIDLRARDAISTPLEIASTLACAPQRVKFRGGPGHAVQRGPAAAQRQSAGLLQFSCLFRALYLDVIDLTESGR